tara:strand:- start:1215 stop:1445 length:231 start_codon:yes stop_codon:yes gene_type:complete
MRLKDGTIIEKSRPMAANEFIFYKSVVIDTSDIWELFDYISKVSNIEIKEIDTDNIMPRSGNYNNPIAIRINKKHE